MPLTKPYIQALILCHRIQKFEREGEEPQYNLIGVFSNISCGEYQLGIYTAMNLPAGVYRLSFVVRLANTSNQHEVATADCDSPNEPVLLKVHRVFNIKLWEPGKFVLAMYVNDEPAGQYPFTVVS